MKISATVNNAPRVHKVSVATEGMVKSIPIPPKNEGQGSSVNGGELLFLALATCFCNDAYREAAKRKMEISSVDVTVTGRFGAEGEPASHIRYEVHIVAPKHSDDEIKSLIRFVDRVAEVHNTLRRGVGVNLVDPDVETV
jgi:uncharacterized OsmC-like protein